MAVSKTIAYKEFREIARGWAFSDVPMLEGKIKRIQELLDAGRELEWAAAEEFESMKQNLARDKEV